jgi:ATP-binding cassette subfamily C protein
MLLIRKLLSLLDRSQRYQLCLVLAGTLLAGMLEMVGISAIPLFVSLLIEPAQLSAAFSGTLLYPWTPKTNDVTGVLYGAALLATFFLGKNLYLTILVFAETGLTAGITASISSRLFQGYLYSPYTVHLRRNPAEFVRNITEEVFHSIEFLKGGMRLIREGLVLIVVLLVLVFVDPLVSIAVFSLLALATVIFYLGVRHALTERGLLSQEHWSRQIQIINQAMGAIKEIKIFGREAYLISTLQRELSCIQMHDTFYLVVGSLPKLFIEVLAVGALLLVATAFMLLGRPAHSMLPVLALVGVAVVRLAPAITVINTSLADLRYKRASLELVCNELQTFANCNRQPCLPGSSGKFQASIKLNDVRYTYPGATTEAIRGISLEIAAGEAVGFIGTSGAGKSTLVDIILGLLTPSSGEVRADGSVIQNDLRDWQRQIGYVPQDIYLMDDTIRRNVAFALPDKDIDQLAVSRALEAAQLNVFVNNLPLGINTVVGNRGIRLSGGQRQRIGIARALYHDPRLLVMDEATSSLDNETEREVIEAIGRLRGTRTIVMIAHRLTTVKGCDKLYLLENGRVKNQGTFDELSIGEAILKQLISMPSEEITVI